jgi:hypothetical protein
MEPIGYGISLLLTDINIHLDTIKHRASQDGTTKPSPPTTLQYKKVANFGHSVNFGENKGLSYLIGISAVQMFPLTIVSSIFFFYRVILS